VWGAGYVCTGVAWFSVCVGLSGLEQSGILLGFQEFSITRFWVKLTGWGSLRVMSERLVMLVAKCCK